MSSYSEIIKALATWLLATPKICQSTPLTISIPAARRASSQARKKSISGEPAERLVSDILSVFERLTALQRFLALNVDGVCV